MKDQSDEPGAEPGVARAVPWAIHRWNFWVCGSEAALYMTAMKFMGPMTLIPFLFEKTGIHSAWLGLFGAMVLFADAGGPIGSARAGGREWKLPFCLRVALYQRLPFLMVPIAVTVFFVSPGGLLAILVFAWALSSFIGGIAAPVYQVVITNSVRESWWARMMGLRNTLSALFGLGATAVVWYVNRVYAAPYNYIVLTWIAVGLMFVSWQVMARIREVPIPGDRIRGPQKARATFDQMRTLLRDDPRIRWIVLARVLRSFGFWVGTYVTAVFIVRSDLGDGLMWIPVFLNTLPQIIAHMVAGWFVDRYGVKPALIVSSVIVGANAIMLAHCQSVAAFVAVFFILGFGGSLLANSWPTLLMKLAPVETRSAYFATISLCASPGTVLVMLLGIALVLTTGYDYIFYVGAAGTLLSAAVFAVKLPAIQHAP